MTPKEIQESIAEKFHKRYDIQTIRHTLAGLTIAEAVTKITPEHSDSEQYRITENGCVTVAEIRRYAKDDPKGRFAELVRPSMSPNVSPIA
jgi:hypothetical protein